MARVDIGEGLRRLYPAPSDDHFFGVDRDYPFAPTTAQTAWWNRSLWQRAIDWARGRQPPPGPRLAGWRVVVDKKL